MVVNTYAVQIINILEQAGAEGFVVGGCVRDSLLQEMGVDKQPKDWDITTSMEPDKVIALFKENGYNVLPTGLKHGTVTVFPVGCKEGYEITTYRIDGEYTDGRHPSNVSFAKTFKEDASRRDFTINAMGYSKSKGIVDYFGGMEDLKNGIIRTVGNPDDRFNEDALRMMRAVRFSAQLGFDIDESVLTSIKKNAHLINIISKERIHDELSKILMSDHPEKLEVLFSTGLLKHFLPELHLCFMTKQNNPWHLYDVGHHTLEALKHTEKDMVLRLAVMMHDVGKPACKKTDENGIDHFKGHPEVSAKKAEAALKNLKFTTKEVEDVVKLISVHDARIVASGKTIKKFMNKHELDDRLFRLYIKLRIADCMGQNRKLSDEEIVIINQTLFSYEEVKEEPISVKDLAVNGNDVMAMGWKGPEVGRILRELLDIVIQDASLNDRAVLLPLIKENI